MADNTQIPGGGTGDVIATDDLTTLNGGAVSGVKAQRTKVGWGVDGTFTDASATNPLPTSVQSIAAGLALPIVGSAPAQSTATWTSATALNTALTYSGLAPYGAVTIGVTVPTTATAGAVTIETSLDGTNWTPAGAVRVDNSLAENVVPLAYFPGTNGTRQYLVSLDALTQVRVRLSTVIVGAGNTVIIIAPAQQGVEPLVATRARKVPNYRAVYRGATRPYYLDKTFTANTRVQYATIHHAAASTKLVKLRKVSVQILGILTAAVELSVDLVRITAAPATGNPAITPVLPDSSNTAVEATCLALPTTAGTEAASPFLPWSSQYVAYGITGSPSTASPLVEWPRFDLVDPGVGDDEAQFPTIRPGVLEGWAVVIDSTAAGRVLARVEIQFTEESP